MNFSGRKTKIFLDGADFEETKEIISELGFLDGQTTNPTLLSKNAEIIEKCSDGQCVQEDVYEFYKKTAQRIADVLPAGSVSIEIYSDRNTTSAEMVSSAEELATWIPNAHIKFPTTAAGLEAAGVVIKKGIGVNMTLVFSQEQAAAVYAATSGAKPGQVFISPFVGRLDDQGEDGMDLVANIIKMYSKGDGHVQVLTASVRSLEHFLQALKIQSDIITSPAKILRLWNQTGQTDPDEGFVYQSAGLSPIEYKKLDLEKNWTKFNIYHRLTDDGLEKFSADWNGLFQKINK